MGVNKDVESLEVQETKAAYNLLDSDRQRKWACTSRPICEVVR